MPHEITTTITKDEIAALDRAWVFLGRFNDLRSSNATSAEQYRRMLQLLGLDTLAEALVADEKTFKHFLVRLDTAQEKKEKSNG